MATSARVAAAPDHSASNSDPSILGAILLPGVTLAIWARALPPAVTAWLDAIDVDAIDDLDFICNAATAETEIADALNQARYPESAEARWLRSDIAALVGRHASILDLDAIALRLEVIETDACRKFHADYTTARTVTTYRGPGTQWLSDESAGRLARGASLDDLTIEHVATGEVAIMKGLLWAPDAALVHRSPPIAGTGIARLTLTLDPPPIPGDD